MFAGRVKIVSKKEGKDQELIQSSTTPDPGYQWESDNITIGQVQCLNIFVPWAPSSITNYFTK